MAKKPAKRAAPKKRGNLSHEPQNTPPTTPEQLTDDQRQALFLQNLRKIKRLKDEIASATSNLRNAFKAAKADGYAKKDIDFALLLEKDEDDAMLDERRRQAEIARWLNHPLGTQSDLFESAGDERSIHERGFAEGKLAGMDGKECKPPDNYSPASDGYNGWIEGWHRGQEAIFAIKKKPDDAPLLQSAEPEQPAGGDDFDKASDGGAPESPWPDDVAVSERTTVEADSELEPA